MNKFNYPLASSTWDKEEIKAIKKVVENGNFTMGKEVKKYEKLFAKYIGSKKAIMVNSGSSANLIMIASLFFTDPPRLKRGDEVIVPAVSWSTTYAPLQQYGLKLKFVDIDLNTLNIDLNMLEKSISDETKMIFLVNLLGNPNDFDQINNIIANRDIFFIEDNCESLGAVFDGKKAGSFGIMGSFSSFFSHHISTMEGGIVVTDDNELYEIMLSLRAHGWTRDLNEKNTFVKIDKKSFYSPFNFVLPGYNLRPLEIEAAIGIEQLKKLPNFILNRRNNALIFNEINSKNNNLIFQKEIGNSSWFGFSMIAKDSSEKDRSNLISFLKENKIEYRPIVSGNFALNPVMKYFNYVIPHDLKNANYMHKNGLFIGNHHYDLSKDIPEILI